MKGRFPVPAIHLASFTSLLLFLVAALLASGAMSVRGQSALDSFDPNANDVVRVVVAQPDGKILLGGTFTTLAPNGAAPVTRNHIARLNADGTLDIDFNPNANGQIYAIALQANGKILLGGLFTTLSPGGGGAVTRNHIARLNPDGTLDAAFDPNADGIVHSIAVQTNGQILAGGFFATIGGGTRNFIARLDAITGLADSFDPNANAIVSTIAVQADGRILLGGSFTSVGGQTRNHIARLDAGSGLADSFDPNASQAVVSIAIQADGKILAAGQFMTIGEQQRHRIARLDPVDGSPDSFDPIADNAVNSIVVQADGKILVGGFFTTIGPSDRPNGEFGQTRNHIARLDPLTGLPDSFDPNANDPVLAVAVQGDGKVLAGGLFTTLAPNAGVPVTRNRIARLGPAPTPTPTQPPSPTPTPTPTPSGTPVPTPPCPVGEGCGGTPTAPPIPTPIPVQARNFSTRMRVLTGDNVGIGGFIITGTVPKHVLVRAIGPSLIPFGVLNALADPVLELHGPAVFVPMMSDNWRDDPVQEAAILATGLAPRHNLESAIDATLNPGAYTAIVRGMENSSGVALIEVYDTGPPTTTLGTLANISTRAFVSTGNDIVIAGFILVASHQGVDRIVARGIGPSLAAVGVPNPLADPTIELRDGNGALLIANDNWQDNPDQAAELAAAGLAPTNQLESGIAATLPAGLYTALLAGLNNGTGVGLVEVYDRGAP